MNRANVLKEVLNRYKNYSIEQFEYWLLEETEPDSDRMPALMPCEILWDVCMSCGQQYLNWPGKCIQCKNVNHIRLGSNQSVEWCKKNLQKTIAL